MMYRILEPGLYQTADASKDYFNSQMGLSHFVIEQQIDDDIEFRPTLSCRDKDHYLVCIEVSESAWPKKNTLDGFVLDCKNRGLPVKLYVAIPKGLIDPDFSSKLRRARGNGVGVVEIETTGRGHVFQEALPLSLTGIRPNNPIEFPAKYRASLRTAEITFCNGNPNKGCSDLYDIIEELSRKLAKKTKGKGYWRALQPGEKPPKVKLGKDPWAKVIKILEEHLEIPKCGCPRLTDALLARVRGITPHRNDSGHSRSLSQLQRRDQELRTRFETARDLLRDLINATKPLHL
jgi:hypothetical protein